MSANGYHHPADSNLKARLAQLVDVDRTQLAQSYQRVLQEALFSRRTTIRPNMVKQIASDEIDLFISFLQTSQEAVARGAALQQIGLNEQPVLRMSQVTRQFFAARLRNEEIASALEIIDAYQEQLMLGFIQSLEKEVFRVQERTRQAYERVSERERP
ncbi:MAG: hypothetical protein H6657_21850 [Ardenticatenaceae bacterium]|nr:hypothetical protein [Ardenticatenaceae bacterium]